MCLGLAYLNTVEKCNFYTFLAKCVWLVFLAGYLSNWHFFGWGNVNFMLSKKCNWCIFDSMCVWVWHTWMLLRIATFAPFCQSVFDLCFWLDTYQISTFLAEKMLISCFPKSAIDAFLTACVFGYGTLECCWKVQLLHFFGKVCLTCVFGWTLVKLILFWLKKCQFHAFQKV